MSGPGVGTVVLDLDGVLYLDSEGVPGAGDALATLASRGWRFVYATNNSTKSAEMVASHIAERTGFVAAAGDAVTSGMAAAAYLDGRASTAAVVGSQAIRRELASVGIEVVDFEARPEVVVVGLDRGLTYDAIDRAARAIREGATLVATNIDATYPTPTGLAPGAGTLVAAIATASGTEPVSCGKPADAFAALVHRRITSTTPAGARTVVMVGDRPETDLALGRSQGWTTVLALSGVTRSPDDVPFAFRPDHVVSSIADVPDLLAQFGG